MSEEPDFEARDQWGNALWYKCHTCGHVWKAGQSGSHNCVDLLKPALDAALARAEKAEEHGRDLQATLIMTIQERDLFRDDRDEARAECARLRKELDHAHSIEAELITLKAQDRLDPLRLEMAEAEANGLRLLHESDKARISELESECARLKLTTSLPLGLWCKSVTVAASKDPEVIRHYTSLGGDVIGLEEHRQILAARLARLLRIFEDDSRGEL